MGKKFVRWGKVDFLSPLDVVNHFNAEVPALVDVFEAPLADPLLHVTVYPTDELALELVYVPFLAPYVIAVDDLDIDFQFGLLDVDMEFRNPGRWSRSRSSPTRCTARSPTPPSWRIYN